MAQLEQAGRQRWKSASEIGKPILFTANVSSRSFCCNPPIASTSTTSSHHLRRSWLNMLVTRCCWCLYWYKAILIYTPCCMHNFRVYHGENITAVCSLQSMSPQCQEEKTRCRGDVSRSPSSPPKPPNRRWCPHRRHHRPRANEFI